MPKFYFNEDTPKIRLYLDKYTYQVLQSDLHNFSDNASSDKPFFFSNIINRIFINFYVQAKSSTYFKCQQQLSQFKLFAKKCCEAAENYLKKSTVDTNDQKEITDALKKIASPVVDGIFIEVFKNDKANEVYISKGDKKFREKLTFVPNKNTLRILEQEDLCIDVTVVGDYISMVVDEYALLPYVDREKIYFKENIDFIQAKIDYETPFSYPGPDNTIEHLLPYKILHSKIAPYNYVLFKTWSYKPEDIKADASEKSDVVPKLTCRRLSNIDIEKAKPLDLNNDKYKITAADKTEYENEIKQKDIMFLVRSTKTIKVKLTPKGIKDYNTRIHMRPNYTSTEDRDDGCKTYTFDCSEKQCQFYFFRFGADAEILEPKKLIETFKKHYQQAFNLYKENKDQ